MTFREILLLFNCYQSHVVLSFYQILQIYSPDLLTLARLWKFWWVLSIFFLFTRLNAASAWRKRLGTTLLKNAFYKILLQKKKNILHYWSRIFGKVPNISIRYSKIYRRNGLSQKWHFAIRSNRFSVN